MSRSELSQVNSEICQSTVTLSSGGVGAQSAEETEGGTKEAGGAGRSLPPLAAAPSKEEKARPPKHALRLWICGHSAFGAFSLEIICLSL